MRGIIIFILCLSISIIWLFLAIPVPPDPPQPTAIDLEAQREGIVIITRDILSLMEANPFESVGIYTISGNGEKALTSIPSLNDIEYSLGMADAQRRYFIFRKVFKALNCEDLKVVGIYPLPKPNNLKI